MLIYYRSVNTTNIFNIGFYPAALGVLRNAPERLAVHAVRARVPLARQ